MPALVLLIDQDRIGRDRLATQLLEAGFQVAEAEDGPQGLALARQLNPQLIVMDLLLPGLDGLSVLQRLRRDQRSSRTPILLLTALASLGDKVRGFTTGADDYLTKPYASEELLARLQALLRVRASTPQQLRAVEVLRYGPLTLVPESCEALWHGEPVRLTRTEFELLHCLLQRHGQVVPWAVLLREIWGYGPDNDVESIRTHVRHLRAKLEPDPHRPVHIKTIYGIGYCLDLPLDAAAGSAAGTGSLVLVGESPRRRA
ncbi:response regulator transcription factor [Synechococcus sp. RedBA-s]|uniref:response regulator transcription factor n=1 Tax=Synechococcus sp. RedBA-s TaxID=2823741 RepID=UPI0020CF7B51|nr:response regulator transcription factor [Synechococcus sp. RedBA-s]MCP9800031.1 response regulator transcription factor [Synechococcus sp. RedBA-s]